MSIPPPPSRSFDLYPSLAHACGLANEELRIKALHFRDTNRTLALLLRATLTVSLLLSVASAFCLAVAHRNQNAAAFSAASNVAPWINLAGLAIAGLWIAWQYRVTKNPLIHPRGTFVPSMAIWGWLTPLGNLVLPWIMMSVLGLTARTRARKALILCLISAWWVTWVWHQFVGLSALAPDHFPEESKTLWQELEKDVSRIIAAALALVVVTAVQRRADQLIGVSMEEYPKLR